MSIIPDELIEQVRDSADIVALVGESVDLKRTGSDFRGACPFHGGKNRNFAVVPKKGMFYCYVCHEAGDVFAYFMKRFGMDYPTAVRDVARRVGIVIPDRPERAGPDDREPLFSAVAAAHDWFARQLIDAAEAGGARDYLAGRDFPMEHAAQLGLGYAPRSRRAFFDAMGALGISEPVLLEAGLAARRDDGSVSPRFRGRLLFPIHDLRGRVVGFGGRLLGPGEPKYLNSPETRIFHKGSQLYNLHQAKQAIRKQETAILVEGYFDVLRLVVAGVEHVVAPLGTALTADQAALLKRYAPEALLLYDSDQAGLRATFRAGDELLRRQVRVRVATMPPGEDPDTLVRRGGAAALEPILRDAADIMELKIQLLERKGWFTDVEHRRDALDRLLPTIRAAADPITRELYLSLVAERTGVSREVLAREAAGRAQTNVPHQPAAARARGGARSRGSAAERELLRVLLGAPEWIPRARSEVPVEWLEFPPCRELYEALVAEPAVDLPDVLSPAAQELWEELKATVVDGDVPEPDRAYAESCRTLEARPYLHRYRALKDQLRATRDPEQQAALMGDMTALGREITTRFPEEWTKRFHQKPNERVPRSGAEPRREPNAS